MYAIIDIETTGGSAQRDRITEIAILIHDGKTVVDEFTSLVNPEVYIPPYITRLTGITNEMVESAPRFYEIARKIVEITENTVFVAHNAQFDYGFIKEEFKRLGFDYSRDTLCTVKLSRKNLPGFSSYSLGVLCQNLGIKINGRHRAAGDAWATSKVFDLIISKDTSSVLVGKSAKEILSGLHPNLDPKRVTSLPERTGVYYFYNQEGRLLYVGKSNSIRKRVMQHLSGAGTKRALEMRSQVADIDFEITGSELIALILEADQIKENIPVFNKKGRRKAEQVGIFASTDDYGYINLSIGKDSVNAKNPLASFANVTSAQNFMYALVDRFNLCQKLCGLYSSNSACFQHQIGQCRGACIGVEPTSLYNIRAQKAIDSLGLESKSFLLIDEGRTEGEKSFVKVVNGKVEGYGYFEPDYVGANISLLFESIKLCGNHKEAILAVRSFLAKAKKGQVVML
jgi:DNA polymerase-3 subunit epsilon